jgi:hypothetical protein
VPPTLVRPTRRTHERGRQSPRRGDGRLFRTHTGPRRDVGLVRRVSSVTIGPVEPSPPSRRHPRRCRNAGRQDTTTPVAVSSTASRQLHPRVSPRATTERKTPTPPPSKPLLEGYRARHDVPPEARFVRTSVYCTALYATPSHLARTARHACKLPTPWPIKGGAVPWPQGDEVQHSLARFLPSPRYWHLASIKPQGPGGFSSSPALLVAPLCKHHGATQYSASSTLLLDVRPRPEPG